jgi:hypothetical protein
MFKRYKLKPSFPIIKDNKTKDRAGQGRAGQGRGVGQGRSINLNLMHTIFLYSSNWISKNQSELI